MDMIIDTFTENPLLLIAIIVFLICVVIGFFGDKYLRSQNKIGKILENNKEEKEEIVEEAAKEEELVETNPTLITSENVNDVNVVEQPVSLTSEPSVQNQMVNDGVTPIGMNTNAVDNSFSTSNFAMPQEMPSEPNQQTDIVNNVFTNPLDNQSQEISGPIVPETYPAENNPQDISGAPVPFDGQIVSDENINNIF